MDTATLAISSPQMLMSDPYDDPQISGLNDAGWAARPIAASDNLKTGSPMRFDGVHRVDGTSDYTTLRCTIELNQAFPVASGLFALHGTTDATLKLNGQSLGFEPVDHLDRMTHLWAHLRTGANEFELTVPTDARISLAVQMRDLDLAGDGVTHDVAIDRWTSNTGQLVRVEESSLGDLFDRPRRSIELRHELSAGDEVTKATLTLIGPTLREVRINGSAISDTLLEPGWTDYRKRLTPFVHDVTDFIDAGRNDLRIILGNGWFTGGMGWQHRGRFAEQDTPLWIAAELTLEYADGSTSTHATDDTWRWRPSSTHFDTLYDGEHRGPVADDWQSASVVDVGNVALSLALEPPIRVVESLTPITVTQRGPGRFVLDFGQNHTGVCAVDLAGVPEGSALRLRHAELLTEAGELEIIYLRTARCIDRYVVGGSETTWVPRFVYHGYRYAEISGLPAEMSAEDVGTRITSRVMHSDVADAGDFDCSNPLLNRIHNAVRWGLRSNLFSTMTDCPQRDERLGWTGDVQIIADTAPCFFDMHGMYRKYLLDTIDAQHADGGVPYVAPQTVVDDVSMAWGDVIVALPWTMWQQYGDRAALELAYPAIRKWLDFLNKHEDNGKCTVITFGDWVPVVETPPHHVAQAWSSQSPRIAARIARLLGHRADAERFDADADRRGRWYHENYFDKATGRYEPDTQTAQVLPLAFGITPAEHVESVRAALIANVERHDGHLTTGFIGAPHLLHALSNAGRDDLALGMIATPDKPSLGYMVEQGGTTIWERWDSDTSGPDMNSRNHFAYGSLTRWLFEHLAGVGVTRSDDGDTLVTLRPRPIGDLTHAEVRRELAEGTVQLRWERSGSSFRVTGTVPAGVRATIHWHNATPPAQHTGITPIDAGYRCAAGTFELEGTV